MAQTTASGHQKKESMTPKQIYQFNQMLVTLKKIAKDYETPAQIRKGSKGQWGLDYEEALEMAYENIQSEANYVTKGVKPIPVKPTK